MFKKMLRNGLFRKVSIFFLQIISFINKFIPKNGKSILIYDGTNTYPIDNSLAVFYYLQKNNLLNQFNVSFCIPACKESTIYGCTNLNAMEGVLKFITSKYVFFSFGDMRIAPSEQQVVVQLGHGMPFKKCGKMGVSDKEWNDEKLDNFTYYVSTSVEMSKILAEVFGTKTDKAIVSGQPRCDLLYKNSKRRTIRNIDFSRFQKRFLWMPTFRKSSNGRFNDSIEFESSTGLPITYTYEMLKEIDIMLKQTESLMVIKSHRVAPLDISNKNFENIYILTNDDLKDNHIFLYEFISWFDCLITDYSSVFIDYLLLDRPIIFTVDDYDSYQKGRGFTFEPARDFMPGEKVENLSELLQAIEDVIQNVDNNKADRNRINHIFNMYQSNFTERLLSQIGIASINNENSQE